MLNERLLNFYADVQKRKQDAAPVRRSESQTAVARAGLIWVQKLLTKERGLDIDGMSAVCQHQFETIWFGLRPFIDKGQLTLEDAIQAAIGGGLFTGLELGFTIAENWRYVVMVDDNPDSDNPDPPEGWDGTVWLVYDAADASAIGDFYTRPDAVKFASELNARDNGRGAFAGGEQRA